MNACKCKSLSQELTGEGCDVCNPARGLEYARQTIADQAQEIRGLEEQLANANALVNVGEDLIKTLRAKLAEANREAAEAQAKLGRTVAWACWFEFEDESTAAPQICRDEPYAYFKRARLVAAIEDQSALQSAIEQAKAKERETCAVVAENSSQRHTECGIKIARAIRARSPA